MPSAPAKMLVDPGDSVRTPRRPKGCSRTHTSVTSCRRPWSRVGSGDIVGQPNAYMLDERNGANVLTIAVGHSLDVLNYVLGEFTDLFIWSGLALAIRNGPCQRGRPRAAEALMPPQRFRCQDQLGVGAIFS